MKTLSSLKPTSQVLDSVKGLEEFVQQLTADTRHFDGAERRAERRFPICIACAATPCDAAGNPRGSRFAAVTRDISLSGISLLCTAEIADRQLLLEFEGPGRDGFQIAMEVLRCRPLGPFWEVGGRFRTDAGE